MPAALSPCLNSCCPRAGYHSHCGVRHKRISDGQLHLQGHQHPAHHPHPLLFLPTREQGKLGRLLALWRCRRVWSCRYCFLCIQRCAPSHGTMAHVMRLLRNMRHLPASHCGLLWFNYCCDVWNGIQHSLSLANACLPNVCLLMQGTMLRATWLRRRALPSKQDAVAAACFCYSVFAYLPNTRWERGLSRVCGGAGSGLLRSTDMRRHATLSAICRLPSSGRSP